MLNTSDRFYNCLRKIKSKLKQVKFYKTKFKKTYGDHVQV